MSTKPDRILSEEAVREIEAHLKRWDRGEVSKQTFPVNWTNANALCQTVRALQAESDQLRAAWKADSQQLTERLNEAYQERLNLQVKLSEVKKEREQLREQLLSGECPIRDNGDCMAV